jgi:hypothetical protein
LLALFRIESAPNGIQKSGLKDELARVQVDIVIAQFGGTVDSVHKIEHSHVRAGQNVNQGYDGHGRGEEECAEKHAPGERPMKDLEFHELHSLFSGADECGAAEKRLGFRLERGVSLTESKVGNFV